MTILELCAKYNLSASAIVGTPHCSPKALPARIEYVAHLRELGWNYRSIARALKCSRSTAHRYGKYYPATKK